MDVPFLGQTKLDPLGLSGDLTGDIFSLLWVINSILPCHLETELVFTVLKTITVLKGQFRITKAAGIHHGEQSGK